MNAKCPDVMVDYKLVELSVFSRFESFNSSDSDSTNGSNSDSFFPYAFLGNTKLLVVGNYPKYTSVEDFGTRYSCEERVTSFQQYIILFGSNEDNVILEICYEEEHVNMVAPLHGPSFLLSTHFHYQIFWDFCSLYIFQNSGFGDYKRLSLP